MEYLVILISVFLISISLKLKYNIQLFNSAKEGMLLAVLLLAIGGLWDSYAILRGYWSFNRQFFIGISIGVMPLEEYLFMLIIPFLVLVLYRIVTKE